MAASNPNMALVGRGNVLGLVEYLIHRGRRLLPIIVLYGPGGSGKTTTIAHLERYFNENTLLARVELTQDNSKRPRDVLEKLAVRLCQDSHKHTTKLRLPRYEIARIIVECASETSTDPNAHKLIRRRLSEKLATLFEVGEAFRTGAEASTGIGGFLGRLVKPLSQWAYSAAVVAPQPLRWLLIRPKYAAALRWYERQAGWRPTGTPVGVRVDNVGAHVHRLVNDESSEDAREQLDRMMVAALLADLRSEFRFRRSYRFNCLALLDNADLLAPDEAEMWAVKGAPGPVVNGRGLLDLLAEEMREHPDTPLLTVATKQAAPAADGFDESVCEVPDGIDDEGRLDRGERDRREAYERHQRWLRHRCRSAERSAVALRQAFLPVKLDSLTLEETGQLLHEISEIGEHTAREDVRVQELHDATHGHPQAIHLVSRKLSRRANKNSTVPSVRSIFEELARPDVPDADGDETVRGYLLTRFLQRFRTEASGAELWPDEEAAEAEGPVGNDRAVRRETTELLARFAAPLRLDKSTVDILAADRAPEDLRRIKDSLSILSFVRTAPDGGWILHPLLRDLLVGELVGADTEPGFSYEELHRKLAEHFDAPWAADTLSMDYHLLALGERRVVAQHFAERAQQASSSRAWQQDLDGISRAPEPVGGMSDETRQWLDERDPTRQTARWRPFEQVLKATLALRSCTGRRRWDAHSLRRINAALDRVAALDGVETERWPHSSSGRIPEVPANLRANPPYPHPPVRFSFRRVRRFTGFVLVLALVGYGVAYGAHLVEHCERSGLISLAPVRAVWNDTMMLTQLPHGQCIGLTTGAAAFSADGVDGPDEHEIAELARLIYEENQLVERRKRRWGTPYVTIVVSTILSTTQQPPRHGLSVGVNELRGAYLAQRQWNGFARGAGLPPFSVRVVLANLGGRSAHADDVAEKIRKLVEQDPTVVGVTGLGQTRDAVVRAVDLLGPSPGDHAWNGVPMVASAISGDAFGGEPYFFRVAVPNQRQADVGAEFLAGLEGMEQRKTFLLYDRTDPYSDELATDYEHALEDHPDAFTDPVHLHYEAGSDRLYSTLKRQMRRMCGQSLKAGRKPLLIYTGRANEMFSVLNSLGATECAVNTLVMGGDDLAQLEMSASSYLLRLGGFRDGQLMFTSFGTSRAGWKRADPPLRTTIAQEHFFAGYRRMRAHQDSTGGAAYRGRTNGHVVAAYDAMGLLIDAVQRAELEDEPIPDRESVYRALLATTGTEVYYGASGVIDFGGADSGGQHAGADPRCKFVSVQRVVGLRGDLHSEHVTAFGTAVTRAPLCE